MKLFVFIIVTLALALVGSLIFLIWLPIKNVLVRKGLLARRSAMRMASVYVLSVFVLAVCFTVYMVVPGRDFYEEEFNSVTLRDLPKSAEIIEKSAGYPDFHGEYCSSSQIRLTKADYSRLLHELTNDSRITRTAGLMGCAEFDEVLGDKKHTKMAYSFTRKIAGEDDHYLSIGFYDDGQTIFVNVCVT